MSSQLDPITLPSGAVLRIQLAPFGDANALRRAFLKVVAGVQIDTKAEAADMLKDAICSAFSSEELEHYIWLCMKRCTYDTGKGPLKFDKETTFESPEAREDYIVVLTEVGKANLLPFGKSLFKTFSEYQNLIASTLKSPDPTPSTPT